MFKVNNKDSVSIVNFEHVIAGWVLHHKTAQCINPFHFTGYFQYPQKHH